jgi:hypothetical protein
LSAWYYPAQVKEAASLIKTPSGGIGQEDFHGLANFSGLAEKSVGAKKEK